MCSWCRAMARASGCFSAAEAQREILSQIRKPSLQVGEKDKAGSITRTVTVHIIQTKYFRIVVSYQFMQPAMYPWPPGISQIACGDPAAGGSRTASITIRTAGVQVNAVIKTSPKTLRQCRYHSL